MWNKLENFGSLGAVLSAAACPVCFPKLALIGSFLGLGVFAKYEVFFFYGAQVLILITLAGHVNSYKRTKNRALLTLAVISAALFFVSLYVIVSEVLAYIALSSLVLVTIWLVVESRRCDRCVVSTTH